MDEVVGRVEEVDEVIGRVRRYLWRPWRGVGRNFPGWLWCSVH